VLLGAGPRDRCGAEGEEAAQSGEAVVPALAAGGAVLGEKVRAVVGVRVLRAAVGMMRAGAEKVEVDAVHGFRPVARIAPWECGKSCDTASQEFQWDER
jgi:hypothetical protein